MSKYIDADRLRMELEKRLKNVRDYMNGAGMKYKGPKYFKAQGRESAYDALLNTIDSLQQEQQEVVLEKEIDACWYNWLSPSNQKEVEGVLPKTEFAMYARHFYELGLNVRKEE